MPISELSPESQAIAAVKAFVEEKCKPVPIKRYAELHKALQGRNEPNPDLYFDHGYAPVTCHGRKLFRDGRWFWLTSAKGDILYAMSSSDSITGFKNFKNPEKTRFPEVVKVSFKEKEQWIFSADIQETNETIGLASSGDITLSFQCLSRLSNLKAVHGVNLLDKKNIKLVNIVARRLAAGSLKLVDCVPDDYIDMTPAEKKINNQDYKKLQSPKPGYNRLGQRWHRTSSSLVYDTVRKVSYLLGRDEDSYFGCELADNPKTIDQAYLSLMPKEVRGKKTKWQRQGEWFMAVVDPAKVPKANECIALGGSQIVQVDESRSNSKLDYEDCSIALPVEHDDSARHVIMAPDIRVARNGQIYAEFPVLGHSKGEHKDISCTSDQWCTFYRNTAVRSVSVQGVD